jgi:hypothetical protein
MSEPTKALLANALRAAGLGSLADRAATGEFSDFESEHELPKLELIGALSKIYKNGNISAGVCQRAHAIAQAVMRGEWDDTADEAEAWAKSSEAEAALKKLRGL